jgi:putative ABC transport system permease protein
MGFSKFFLRSAWDDERARELEAHLAIEIDNHIARGMSPRDARAAARRKLGNVTLIREEIYRMNTIGFLETILQDVRYGARLLRLNPAFAAVAVLSLALGVGANTAIFQLLDAVRIRTLPVAHPEELVEIRIQDGDGPNPSGSFNGPHPTLTNPLWERVRDRQEAFSSVFAWGSTEFELSSGGESRPAEGLWVSGDFFNTLGVRAVLGRVFSAADDRRGCAGSPAVISHGFWQRQYGGSPSVVGRALTLDGHAFDIVGVTPPGFFGVEVGRDYDVAVPLCAEQYLRGARSSLDRKDAWFLASIGRLKPGWSIQKATAHLGAISAPMFEETLPSYRPEDERAYLAYKLGAFPAGTGVSNLRDAYESPLWLLLATTALVLLVACANLANLMLARATAREREIAVRLALGASRLRIVRQLVAESVLMAVAGAGAGALLAQWLSRSLVAFLTTTDQRVLVEVAVDWRVFSFIGLLAAATSLIFGVMPAIRATATSPGAAMKAGSRGSTDTRERFGLRRALVVVQVALSLVLVVGALLFVRSFHNLLTLDPGFKQENLLIAGADLRRTGIPEARLRSVQRELLDRLRHAPGVEEAAQVRNVPVSGSFSNRNLVIDGVTRKENVNFNWVSDRFFQTMGSPLLAGRDVDERDTLSTQRVAIVTESFARVFFGGQNPVGKTFQIDEPPGQPRPIYQVVGFTRDSKYEHVRDPFEPLVFVPAAQDDRPPAQSVRFVVRSTPPLTNVTSAIVAVARDTHPAIVVDFRTMQLQVKNSLIRERLMATLSGFFGGLAALIAMIGLYGVMSYTVARRRNEIGIRMALGADRRQVVRMIMREAGMLLGAGLIVGTLTALAAARAATTLLFGLQPHDPTTLITAVIALAAVAALASYVPAVRASRLEPTEALREE